MAHGLNSVVIKRNIVGCNNNKTNDCQNKTNKTGIGSRRIFAPHFKLQVLDSYRNDADCKGNQRATARKYGIHRRQIQKWLQVENTLRNTVQNNNNNQTNNNNNLKSCEKQLNVDNSSSNKMDAVTLNGARPRVVVDSIDGRGTTLDHFTTQPSPTVSPIITPMDLSVRKSIVSSPPSPLPQPPSCSTYFYQQSPPPPTSRLNNNNNNNDGENNAWDLSIKAQKRKNDDLNSNKPIKLFKPYLDDIKQETPQVKTILPPCCSTIHIPEPIYYNNNNIIESKNDYNSTYTITELQPKGNSYYYTYNNIIYHPDYDLCNSNGNNYYDETNFMSNTAKQHRQSYSLDFKLSAIDCYYQDSICKGNQRAVATKYNIHRRQIQKWLKQQDELRMRNETMKTVVR